MARRAEVRAEPDLTDEVPAAVGGPRPSSLVGMMLHGQATGGNQMVLRSMAALPVQRCGDHVSPGCACAEEEELEIQRTTETDAEPGPCDVVASELSMPALLIQLNRARLYLSTHKRGEGEFYDYANLLRRLDIERKARQAEGHAWLAEKGLIVIPPVLYSLTANGLLGIRVDKVVGPVAAMGKPESILATPDQFASFLSIEDIPEGDVLDLLLDPDGPASVDLQIPYREHRDLVWVPVTSPLAFPKQFDPAGNLLPLGGVQPDSWESRLLPGIDGVPPLVDPLSAFGYQQQEIASMDTSRGLLSGLRSPGPYTASGPERVYLPSTSDSLDLAGLSTMAPLARPPLPLPDNTTGVMWDGLHTSDVSVLNGDIHAQGFRSSLFEHALSSTQRKYTKITEGHRGGGSATARLNRGTQNASYANDWLFPYMPNSVVVYRVDGTRVDALELRAMMAARTPDMEGQTYRYSNPKRDSQAFRNAFGDQPASFDPPPTSSCVNVPIDIHEQALGGGHFLLESDDGVITPLADPENATAKNMNKWVELPDEWFEARGLRKVTVDGTMRTRAVLPGLLGAGTALAGDLIAEAQGGDPHYARDMTLGAAGGTGGAALESFLAPRATELLISRGASASTAGFSGRLAGGVGSAAIAAPLVEGATMLFDDNEYTGIDYAARMTRSGVSGAVGAGGGMLATAGAGALLGSEVPIVGNAVGFVVGAGVYLFTDWLVGEDIEEGVRDALGENGCSGR